MAFDLTATKRVLSLKLIGIILPFLMLTLIILPLPIISSQLDVEKVEASEEINPNLKPRTVLLTSMIFAGTNSKAQKVNSEYNTKAVTPTEINRGDIITVTGRLEYGSTGVGIPGQVIKIFWEHFTWSEYESDRTNLENNYLLGQGSTNSDGNFSIACRDTDHSKSTGSITVYAVFPGNPLFGPIEENRQYTTDIVDCYGYVILSFLADPTTVRDNSTFDVDAGLAFDNSTLINPQPVTSAEGTDISIIWLGTTYNVTISSSIASTTLGVPNGTMVGDYPLELYYNLSPLGLSYVRGSISGVANNNLWANSSRTIEIFSGAGVVFNIDDPIPPGPAEYPTILRGSTLINITGQLADDDVSTFGYHVTLIVQMDGGGTIISPVTNNTGHFNTSFLINNGGVGDHSITVDVASGQGIVSTFETEFITIIGNSTLVSIGADITRALPGENVTISGIARDAFSSSSIADMQISAQWEDFGPIMIMNTTGSGAFSFEYQVPPTVNPSLENGTIFLQSASTQYYTPSNSTCSIDVFNEVNFRVWLNSTEIINGSNVSTIGGNQIYNDSILTFSFSLTDEYERVLGNRGVNTTIGSYNTTVATDVNGNYTNPITSLLYFAEGNYTIMIIFNDDPTYQFSFTIEVLELDSATTAPPTGTETTPNGGLSLSSQIAIAILISMVSLIIIVSIIYAFGRFRKAKKGPISISADAMDLPTIMKMMIEAESAKDFRRASIFCYHAFEMMCIQNLRIFNAKTQSPRELARLVASTNRIPVRDVTMIVMRFEEARYSDHRINKAAFNHAKQALENVQLALKQEPKVT